MIPGYANLPCVTAAIWSRLHRMTSILMTESTENDKPRSRLTERLKSGVVRSLFDKAITGGTRSLEYLSNIGFPATRTGRFYDVVDNEYYSHSVAQFPASRPLDFSGPYFLYVGRLSAEKNLERLFRAFADYCSRGGPWDLVLVGEGPLRRNLERLAVSLSIESRLRMEGRKTTAELIPFYAYAKALVHPSVSEPWGLVVNEAMAAGLPVIVSRTCGCAPDLIEDKINGCLIDPLDIAQIAETMLQFSRLPEDILRKMGTASKAIIARFSLESWGLEVRRLALK